MRADILSGGKKGLFCTRIHHFEHWGALGGFFAPGLSKKTAAKRQPCPQKPILGHELMILGSPCPQKAVLGHGCCVGSNLSVLVLPIKNKPTDERLVCFLVDYPFQLSNLVRGLEALLEIG